MEAWEATNGPSGLVPVLVISGGSIKGVIHFTQESVRSGQTFAKDVGAGAGWKQGTMSRIVALADCFDAMTAHRSYHKRPFSSFEALQYLLGPNRVQFDPAVLWALVRTVGVYPPGSVLFTSSGHIVVALSPTPTTCGRPFCRVVMNPSGAVEPEDHPTLWSPMPPSERVVHVLKPEEVPVKTTEYLAA